MILSVSRRTDIPNYYAEWFFRRIKEGFLYVRNPMNPHQVSRIELSPLAVDCIVFWTKNPAPMLERLEELREYPYYFQFTLTGYGKDIEPGLPDKRKELIGTFRKLSEKAGRDRVNAAKNEGFRHPANKIAVAGIQPLAVRRLFNGLDPLQFAAGQAVNCNWRWEPIIPVKTDALTW